MLDDVGAQAALEVEDGTVHSRIDAAEIEDAAAFRLRSFHEAPDGEGGGARRPGPRVRGRVEIRAARVRQMRDAHEDALSLLADVEEEQVLVLSRDVPVAFGCSVVAKPLRSRRAANIAVKSSKADRRSARSVRK